MCFQDVKVLNFDNFLGERRGRVVGHRPVNEEVYKEWGIENAAMQCIGRFALNSIDLK